jgi:3-methylcrotonyl-CoA carboxylase alpha subunit
MGHPGKRIVGFENGEQRIDVVAKGNGGNYELAIGDSHCNVSHAKLSEGVLSAAFDGTFRRCDAHVSGNRVFLHDDSQRTTLQRVDAFAFVKSTQRADDRVAAPMPGRIVVVRAKPGDTVETGQELLVMEAMKMEIALKAPHAGKIETVSAAVGDFVEADAILVRFAKP